MATMAAAEVEPRESQVPRRGVQQPALMEVDLRAFRSGDDADLPEQKQSRWTGGELGCVVAGWVHRCAIRPDPGGASDGTPARWKVGGVEFVLRGCRTKTSGRYL